MDKDRKNVEADATDADLKIFAATIRAEQQRRAEEENP
jgi:hypothetical protein